MLNLCTIFHGNQQESGMMNLGPTWWRKMIVTLGQQVQTHSPPPWQGPGPGHNVTFISLGGVGNRGNPYFRGA